MRALVLGAALAWLGAAPAAAQQQPMGPPEPSAPAAPAPPPPPAPPPGPAAIPLTEIASRVEQVSQSFGAIAATLQPTPEIAALETMVREKGATLDLELRSAAERIEEGASLDQIDELAERVTVAARKLDESQTILTARSQEIERQRAELAAMREVWTLTLKSARNDGAPAELIDSIKSVRTQLGALDKQLDERFDAVLKLQSRIGEESLAVSVLAQDLRRARYEVSGRLLVRNRASLPAAFAAVESPQPILRRVGDGLRRDAENVRNFAKLQQERLIQHGLVLVAFLLISWRMRSWVAKRRREGKHLGASEAVFDHPISAALLAALIVAPWIYDYTPRAFDGLLGLLMVLPIVVLLPTVLAPSHKRVWYTIAALYVVGRIRYALQPVELLERSIFAIELILAIALVVGLLRGDRHAELVNPRWARAFTLVLRGVIAVMAASLVAELAGFDAIAKLLGDGVLGSSYVAIVLYAAVNVVRPIVAALLRSRLARHLNLLHGRRDAVERFVTRLVAWGAGLWWALSTLEFFSLRAPVSEAVASWVREPIGFGDAAFSLGDVLLFAVTVAAAVGISRLVRVALEEDVFPRTALKRGVPHAISATIRYGILFAGFLLAAAAAGFEWSKVTLLAGAFGVGIGFGLQNIVNNFVSGLILLYERPIQVGDTVEVGSLMGEVRRIGIRSSTVRTWQGAEVIVPNGNLISEQVVNWTLSDLQRRIDLPIGVSYDADPEQVLSLLQQIAAQHPDVLSEPPPVAAFQGFGDSSLNFELRVWTISVDRIARVKTELGIAIFQALKKADIAIPYPQRDVRVLLAKDAKS
ncbi:MAG: hypothetical protein DCC71_17580 [Proteobacteria bacterium]|nr:MAG: hypothetical protein DCC71_17580 [Pseudomonadota bacterium]